MMKILKFLFLAATLLLGLNSCVDNRFDEPTGGVRIDESKVIPISTVLTAIREGGKTYEEDHYLKGTVTADDATGNFYKQLVIQDETGAINISADQNELNAAYPQGSFLFVKLKGLYLGANNNLPQIGLGVDGKRPNRIPDALVKEYLISGGQNAEAVVPQLVKISDLTSGNVDLYNRLVKIDKVEFESSVLGLTYATPETTEGQRAENRNIQDCDGNSIIVRNSDFASFATETLPSGNGSITAIASVYSKNPQLFIRNTDDVDMTGDRCDGSGGQADEEITIESIKQTFYDKGADKVAEGYITGIVISDRNANITNNRNLYIQNGEHGILVRFSAKHNFDLYEKIQVTVSGAALSEYNGVLQINNVSIVNAISKGKNQNIEPAVVTIDQIKGDFNKYESTIVTIKNGTLPEGKKFTDKFDLEDPTGKIQLFTSKSATFASQSVPSGSVEVTGIVIEYKGTKEIIINDPKYIKGGSSDGGDGDDNGTDDTKLNIGDVRDAYDKGGETAPSGYIEGIVISDKDSKQLNNQNVIIQEGASGILVRFKAPHSASLGDKIKVVISGVKLSEYKGVLQVNGVELAALNSQGKAALPEPKEITVATYLSAHKTYESTRVKISGATLTSSSDAYEKAVTINDGTGKVTTYIQNGASFFGDALPTGAVSVVGIGSAYDSPQLLINSKEDVKP